MAMHWGWYWKIKKKHKPKAVCSWPSFMEIDSFQMFRNRTLVQLVKESADKLVLTIPQYKLAVKYQSDDNWNVQFDGGSYVIVIEKKSCNYGGFYYFFRCPDCSLRMRKLYCVAGKYLCRKCAKLGYYSQRLRPSEQNLYGQNKVKQSLKSKAGSLDSKPPWMKRKSFQRLRIKYVKYDEQWHNERHKELIAWYGAKVAANLESYSGPDGSLFDAWVKRM